MKTKLIAIAAATTLSLGAIALKAQPGPGGPEHGQGHWGNPMEHLTKDLNLTADQQAKIKPIVDAAKPQIEQIHQDAIEKTRTVMENAANQIRPMLTADQQAKFDAERKAHEDMRAAMQEMHEAKKQQP